MGSELTGRCRTWNPTGMSCCVLGTDLDPISKCVYEAAKSGSKEEVYRYLDEEGFPDLNVPLRGAAAGGHEELVREMLQRGAKDNIGATRHAAFEGRRDIVYFLMDSGTYDYIGILRAAAKGQQVDLLEELLEWKPIPTQYLDDLLQNLAETTESLEDLRWIMDRGAINVNSILVGASQGGNMPLLTETLERFDELSDELGFRQGIDLDGALTHAAGGDHLDAVKLLLDNGAEQIDWARGFAMSNEAWDVVSYLSSLGATEARPINTGGDPEQYVGGTVLYSLAGKLI